MMCGLTILGVFVGAITFGLCEIRHLRQRNKKQAEIIEKGRMKAT